MNLNESYRYSNYIEKLLGQCENYLSMRDFITSTKETHLKSKANSEANDEVVIAPKSVEVDFVPMDVVNFAVKLVNERGTLFDAIAKAKKSLPIDIDNAISMNKKKQEFVQYLNSMNKFKDTTSTASARDYKFNAEGNQVAYYYNVDKVTTIDFDRNSVKGLAKKLTKECDEVSNKLDRIQIETEIDFTPQFDITDTFEDAIER